MAQTDRAISGEVPARPERHDYCSASGAPKRLLKRGGKLLVDWKRAQWTMTSWKDLDFMFMRAFSKKMAESKRCQ
jgi:hypothetical protein